MGTGRCRCCLFAQFRDLRYHDVVGVPASLPYTVRPVEVRSCQLGDCRLCCRFDTVPLLFDTGVVGGRSVCCCSFYGGVVGVETSVGDIDIRVFLSGQVSVSPKSRDTLLQLLCNRGVFL